VATLPLKSAVELRAGDSLARQLSRRAARETVLGRRILRAFADRGGPILVEDLVRADDVARSALVALDEADIVRVREGKIDMAYPFSASPTTFVVRLANGSERFACCATDALSIAPMLGQRVEIRSRCHHCGMPLALSATPDAPESGAEGVMLWLGARGDERCRAVDGL